MVSDNLKISIITVCYNAEKTIEKSIRSVVSQAYKYIEYIIIDGGSSDNTVDIIKKHEKYLSFWISERDNGIYSAMNKGVSKATGCWINFMNAGDSFTSIDTISSIFNRKILSDVIYGDTYNVDKQYYSESRFNALPLDTLFKAKMPFTHQSSFIRTDILKKYPYRTDYVLASDFDFFLKIYRKNFKFEYLEYIVVSNFLSGGFHSKNMIKYTAECVNSIISGHDDIENYSKNLEVIEAFEEINTKYKNNNSDLSSSLSFLLTKIDNFFINYKRVIMYGNGYLGQLIAGKYQKKIIAIVDKSISENNSEKKFIPIDKISGYDFEMILITVLGREERIMKELILNGVPKEKIMIFIL